MVVDAADQPVLQLDAVVKEYPGSPPVRALDGVALRIDRGEMVAIVGPSGSGKSTLLNIVGALDVPTTGEVRIAGEALSGLGDKQLSALRSKSIGFGTTCSFPAYPGNSAAR